MDHGRFLTTLLERAGNIIQKLRLRRREPWNWCLQSASLAIAPFGLVTHNAALLTLALLGFGLGCQQLPLPPMEHTEMRRLLPLVERLIGLECAWLAKPLTGRKRRQAIFMVLGAPVLAWCLWAQDLAPVGAALIEPYLLYVRRKNIERGIKP